VVELSLADMHHEEFDFRWVLSVDGSFDQQGSRAGVILEGPNGLLIEQALQFAFKANYNQAECEALITRILLAKEMGAQSLLAKSDSLLVTGQVTGEYQAKDPQMDAYLEYVQVLKKSFVVFELVQVPRIAWSYHTTPLSTTRETPFSLVSGSDAMIPLEIQENLPRFQNFVAEESNEERKVNLDLLDKVREEARIKLEALKRRVEYKYNSKLRPWQFQVVDLVMRKAHPYQLENKLSTKWTGSFRVAEALGNGAYKLKTLEGGAIPRTWNATNLKFYFN